jgi:hypothetical protein
MYGLTRGMRIDQITEQDIHDFTAEISERTGITIDHDAAISVLETVLGPEANVYSIRWPTGLNGNRWPMREDLVTTDDVREAGDCLAAYGVYDEQDVAHALYTIMNATTDGEQFPFVMRSRTDPKTAA